jgi:heptaprenyl diphosphate synthase
MNGSGQASGTTGLFTFPPWLEDDLDRVEALLNVTAGASSHPVVSDACLHLIKAGGKRLRPALVLLASRAGEEHRRATNMSAAAIELIHLASLYHDDVLDETQTRRGVPTAHNKWGIEVAVLAGDYLFAAGCALGADVGGDVPGILAEAIVAVCEGQIVETAAINDPIRPVADYIETIRLKTATLFAAACELGAVTSGAPPETRTALAGYGENLGLAFQVVDDVLDLIGNPDETGKAPGIDLKEGVFTVPVLLACARDSELAGRLAGGDRTLDEVVPVLRSTGAIADATTMASHFGRSALESVAGVGDETWRDCMRTMVGAVLAQVDETVSG